MNKHNNTILYDFSDMVCCIFDLEDGGEPLEIFSLTTSGRKTMSLGNFGPYRIELKIEARAGLEVDSDKDGMEFYGKH